MAPLLYSELVPWYGLVDPPADHLGETTSYREAFERVIVPPPETLLELGAGAGNNAFHLKARFRCTLTDLSEGMLALSRASNPECEHAVADMRTLRLGRTFDAVLVHDAIMYMTTEADLARVAETAFVHLRSGGAAVFAPDVYRETFSEVTNLLEADEGTRSMRGLEWSWDPDPTDDTTRVEYVFVFREGEKVETFHDRHVEGLFAKATWIRILEEAGFRVEMAERCDEGHVDEVFLAVRP